MTKIARTAAHLAIRALLQQKKAESALAQYIDDYSAMTGRTALEWQLAEAIGSGNGAVRAPASWPEAMLARPSGAALAFIVAQRSRTACARPSPLFGAQVLPAGMRRVLARAWAEHPSCVALRDAADRRAFAKQLMADGSAIELLLDAVVDLDGGELAAHVAEEWLRHPMAVARTSIGILQRMAMHQSMWPICREAVGMRIAATRVNGHELVELAQILASLYEHRAVIGVSHLSHGSDLAPMSRHRLIALRLGALGELDADEQLVEEYRREWIPAGPAYPAPEQLLYSLHVSGAGDAVEHLLASPPEHSPRWIHLWRVTAVTKRVTPANIREWRSLCDEHPENGAILVGLTEAILNATASTRNEEPDIVRWVLGEWSKLLNSEVHGVLAATYLVLLERADGDIVRAFDRTLRGVSLSTHPVRRAAVAYVRALTRMREWARLRAFFDSVPADHLRLAFDVHELETHALMVELANDQELPFEEWLASWERLLALPLDTSAISDVLGHFVARSAALRRTASDILRDERSEDVHLQILRRGCAEAERLLAAGRLSPDEIAEVRARLCASDLVGVREVIDDLRLRVT